MDLTIRAEQIALQGKITEVRHQCELIEAKYQTEQKYLDTLLHKDIDVQTHKNKVLEKNTKDRLEYELKIKQINEELEQRQEQYKDKDPTNTKLKKLEKIESKIENNLERHQKTLKFFEENSVCPTCTQPIEQEVKEKHCKDERHKIAELEKGMKELLGEIKCLTICIV